jgi:membrane protease YdiL (CAAX protease family)
VHECQMFPILVYYLRRFGGSFPAQRVKTATSFFTSFAISFPVGSLGEEFGWRGMMVPYLHTLLDRKFGIGRSWKWTPLLQSLITGVIWAVCNLSRLSSTHAFCLVIQDSGVARAGVLR